MTKHAIAFDAKTRTEMVKHADNLRSNALIPAVLYGKNRDNQYLTVEAVPFTKVFREAGESTLIDLRVDGKEPVKTVIYDLAHDPLTNKVTHVDFFQVNMADKLTTSVALEFIGESRAVKEHAGIIVKQITEIEIRCLPGDLVSEIEVDLGKLVSLNDSIKIKDLALSKGSEIMHHDPEDIVVAVTPPLTEEELKKMEQGEAPISVADIKVEEKGKKDEEVK